LTGPVLTVAVARPDLVSLVLVLVAASLAAILARIDRRIVLPTVVLELTLGIAFGPPETVRSSSIRPASSTPYRTPPPRQQ
jgi:Kef-type K+ transport system membrane component KefB